ncbi:hypothetical protein L5F46_04950 [Aliarcobacter butzleri]|uniref:hypothetical protein n=1 Tax=Aliarcobacter butzleri TaxID=28197 RepID=UPI001EDDDAEE|nr:hypothetical protein [Aliarcobacter butzleri]MCG3674122.1 hypothetical protein [Aliarcobacter butzleri]
MWHVKLNNIDEKQFAIIKSLINDKIYSKSYNINDQEYKEYYFIPEDQEIESSPQALSKGEDEIKVLISLLSVFGYENNIAVDCPYEIHSDGTRTAYLTFVDKINVIDDVRVYSNNELLYSTEEEKQKKIKDIYSKIVNSEIKQQLLIYMAKEANWVNAYKIYEILKHNFKSEKDLKQYPELSTFAHTANSPNVIGDEARHSVQKTDNPKIIANLEISYKKLRELSIKFLMQKN